MKNTSLLRTFCFAIVAPLAFSPLASGEGKLPDIKVDEAPLTRTVHNSYAPIVEKVSASVVTISVQKNMRIGGRRGGGADNPLLDDPFFRKYFGIPDEEEPRRNDDKNPGKKGPQKSMPYGLGSGVVVSPDGYVLTNNHVIEEADDILITFEGRKQEFKAKKIGTDPESDIAVLKIEAKDLAAITFADSDKIKVGDFAIAIGSPFNLRQTVTSGIISATGRNETGLASFANFIQTDASINPGNSGGALVDTEGRLVGINTAIFSRSGGNMGIGFAVPSNQARSVMESLIKTGKVQRGFLGIEMQDLNETLAKEFKVPNDDGVLAANVIPGGGADKAGVKSGDVITEVNGKKISAPSDLRTLVSNLAPGTKVEVKYFRDGKEQSLTITLAERPGKNGIASAEHPAEPPKENAPDVLDGVTVSDIKPEHRKRYDIPENVQGAMVTEVEPDSASAAAEIKPGDVIVEVDGATVKNSDEAIKASEDVKQKKSVRLRVSTKGVTRFVVVEELKDR